VASYCHHLIDSGPAFWIVKFVHPQNRLFVRPLFFTNNILIILLTPKDFWVFDFSTQFLSSYRFQTGILDFQICPSSKLSFSAELWSKFSIFFRTPKDFWVYDFASQFSCGKLLSSPNRFRTGISGFPILLSSKSSISAELWSKFSIFFKTPEDFWVFNF